MKIKVCGMKDKDNIDQLLTLIPDFIGFIFHSQSPRYIERIDEEILSVIPAEIKKVGVFVDEPIDSLVEKYLRNKIHILQLHGNEIPEYCSVLHNMSIPVIKAFRINQYFDFRKALNYESSCDYFLFDTAGKLPGGNGVKFDWNYLSQYHGSTPFFLSGGIGPQDLMSILEFSHPMFYGIDINSGFETEPGKKDIPGIGNFIKELRITN